MYEAQDMGSCKDYALKVTGMYPLRNHNYVLLPYLAFLTLVTLYSAPAVAERMETGTEWKQLESETCM